MCSEKKMMKKGQETIGYYNYYFSEDNKQCTIVAGGEPDFEQSVKVMDDVINDPRYSKDMLLLVNLTSFQYHPSYDEFAGLRDHLKKLAPRLQNKIALVCNRKLDILGHLICAFMNMENIEMKTFIKLEDAENWLKVERKIRKFK